MVNHLGLFSYVVCFIISFCFSLRFFQSIHCYFRVFGRDTTRKTAFTQRSYWTVIYLLNVFIFFLSELVFVNWSMWLRPTFNLCKIFVCCKRLQPTVATKWRGANTGLAKALLVRQPTERLSQATLLSRGASDCQASGQLLLWRHAHPSRRLLGATGKTSLSNIFFALVLGNECPFRRFTMPIDLVWTWARFRPLHASLPSCKSGPSLRRPNRTISPTQNETIVWILGAPQERSCWCA